MPALDSAPGKTSSSAASIGTKMFGISNKESIRLSSTISYGISNKPITHCDNRGISTHASFASGEAKGIEEEERVLARRARATQRGEQKLSLGIGKPGRAQTIGGKTGRHRPCPGYDDGLSRRR